MTHTGTKRAFQKLNAIEQADVLKELAATLAKSLSDEDRSDARVFDRRRLEVPKARPWNEVRARVNSRMTRRRSNG